MVYINKKDVQNVYNEQKNTKMEFWCFVLKLLMYVLVIIIIRQILISVWHIEIVYGVEIVL